jgi:hypothetical protein
MKKMPVVSGHYLAQCLGQNVLLNVRGAVLVLVVRQYNTNLSSLSGLRRAQVSGLRVEG